MAIRFDDIGNRLKAFRLGSGLSADEIANRLGISRTALYRFEKGELAKIETLEKLAELLEVSVPTLLGVGVEYIASAVAYFERMRQIEETSEHIVVLAGPISYLLASDAFDRTLADVLRENVPDKVEGRKRVARTGRRGDDGAAPAQGKLSPPPARHRQPDRRVGNGAVPAQWDGRPPRPAGKDAHRAARTGACRGRAFHQSDGGGADGRADRHRSRYAAACELPDFSPAGPAYAGPQPVPARRAAQYPRRRGHDHLGAGSARVAREDGQGPVAARDQGRGGRPFHARTDRTPGR